MSSSVLLGFEVSLRTVIATLRVAGFHCWPEAPDAVKHLRDRHRHEFLFRAEVVVEHEERQVEFQILQHQMRLCLEQLYERYDLGLEFGRRSCETLAQELAGSLLKVFGILPSAVEVWEDCENGSRVLLRPVCE